MTKRVRESGGSAGRMLRPKAVVLDDSALVPPHNLVKPPPKQFTHVISRSQPYFFSGDHQSTSDGTFAEGTRVVLMAFDGGETCRVIDERGLHVETAYDGLRPLSKARRRRKKEE